jgi:transposase-like protein
LGGGIARAEKSGYECPALAIGDVALGFWAAMREVFPLTFYDYTNEHWSHLRTSNVIESPFAAVRLRADAGKRFRTVKSAVHLIHQLLLKQEKKWRKFNGPEKCAMVQLPE